MMGTNSTSVDNPVNQIAALLTGEPEVKEKVAAVEEQPIQQDEDTADENQETVESLEATPETVDENQETVEDEAEQIETLNNLANDLEIDIEDMYALNLNLSNDENMTLGGLKDFYETNRDIEALRQDLTTQKENLQADADTMRSTPQVSNELLQARAQVLSIQDQYNRTDWDGLRADNPGNYAATMQDFQQQFAIAKDNEAVAEQGVDAHQKQARQLQLDRLFEAMPELKDDKVRQEAAASVNKFASRYGFSASDVDNIEDSRLMRLLIDASRITSAQSTAKEKLEKVAPQGNKTSASRPVPSSRKASLKRLTEKAKASGDRRDQTNAVAALLNS